MINIGVKVDPSEVLGYLTFAQEKQLPFAASLALNRTANLAQQAEREHLATVFKLRRKPWIMQGIKIEKADRANKTTWCVIISVPTDHDLLDKFEGGDTKVPRVGHWLWIPNADVFKGRVIDRGDPLNPHNLQFHRHGAAMLGTESTFMINGKNGPLVFQRVDRGLTKKSKQVMRYMDLDSFTVKGSMGPHGRKERHSLDRTAGTRLLYKLVSRVRVPAVLAFAPTIAATVQKVWAGQMQQAMDEAMQSAR